MGALKAPKVSKIERIVCWCHFTRLPKQNKVSYFKIFKVIKKKAEKTLFLFRIAPPTLSFLALSPYNHVVIVDEEDELVGSRGKFSGHPKDEVFHFDLQLGQAARHRFRRPSPVHRHHRPRQF